VGEPCSTFSHAKEKKKKKKEYARALSPGGRVREEKPAPHPAFHTWVGGKHFCGKKRGLDEWEKEKENLPVLGREAAVLKGKERGRTRPGDGEEEKKDGYDGDLVDYSRKREGTSYFNSICGKEKKRE